MEALQDLYERIEAAYYAATEELAQPGYVQLWTDIQSTLLLGSGAAVMLVLVGWISQRIGESSANAKAANANAKALASQKAVEAVEKVVAVSDGFDWKTEKPRPYRPFKKGPYHMTMGIQTCPVNEWLLLEDTYEDITSLRSTVIDENREHTVLAHDMATDAVAETYDVIIGFLTQKYPKYFYVDSESDYVVNGIKRTKIPATAASYTRVKPELSAAEAMDDMIRTISRNIEEDFLILMFDDERDEYFLRAGSFAFPSGFDPAEKLNLALKDIHGPVPLYKEKLEKPMDRFFAKIKVGQFVQRYNWGIQSHTKLYAPSLNHAHEGVALTALDPGQLDFDKVLMRCERQILTRLPRTKHLLFTIRTYTTPLSQIRTEARALDLVDAIDNLPDNVAHYKKREEWGPAVKAYLRGESNGRT